jgi:hypothetical protein
MRSGFFERVSDGTRVSLEVAGGAVGGASVASGTIVSASAIESGVILASAGKAIAFIPNAVGRALLHNEQITR